MGIDSLISWEDCEVRKSFDFHFMGCKVKVPFGPFTKGDTIKSLYVDFKDGYVNAYQEVCGEEKRVFIGAFGMIIREFS